MHIETSIKTRNLAEKICAIFRYDRQSGKFTYDINFVLFPGNFSYLWGSRMEYFPIGKFCLGNLEQNNTCAYIHTPLIHRDHSPCVHS